MAITVLDMGCAGCLDNAVLQTGCLHYRYQLITMNHQLAAGLSGMQQATTDYQQDKQAPPAHGVTSLGARASWQDQVQLSMSHSLTDARFDCRYRAKFIRLGRR